MTYVRPEILRRHHHRLINSKPWAGRTGSRSASEGVRAPARRRVPLRKTRDAAECGGGAGRPSVRLGSMPPAGRAGSARRGLAGRSVGVAPPPTGDGRWQCTRRRGSPERERGGRSAFLLHAGANSVNWKTHRVGFVRRRFGSLDVSRRLVHVPRSFRGERLEVARTVLMNESRLYANGTGVAACLSFWHAGTRKQ